MQNSVEAQVAQQLAHQDRVREILARTGGEIMHQQHYDIRETIRLAVLHAIDDACAENDLAKMSDAELPNLFRALDPIAEKIFLKKMGL